MLDKNEFKQKIGMDPWNPLLEVADFNSLIALSQEHQVPVYALTAEQTGQRGAVWDQTKEDMAKFSNAFSACADKVIALAT